jgi:sec-independent protein translocase protein TatA
MGNVGITEILLIAVVALLLFGAGRIADIGKGLGQGIKNFKQGLKEADEIDAERKDAARLGSGEASDSAVTTPQVKKSDGETTAPKQA